MTFYVCIRIGRWKLQGRHLYRFTEHRDAKTNGQKARWGMWDKIV